MMYGRCDGKLCVQRIPRTAAQALRNLGIYVQSTDPGHANGRIWIKLP
jgi:hypothetical protein